MTPEERRRVRALQHRWLFGLWWLVTPVAVWLLFRDRAWLASTGPAQLLDNVRLEQWIAVALLGIHLWFAWRAWGSRRD